MPTIQFTDAQSDRENVLRLEFDQVIYFTGILDPLDAGNPAKYTVAPVAGTTGFDGNPARAVTAVGVAIPAEADGVATADVGRFVDVTLDRPMTPYPAAYDVTVVQVRAAAPGSGTLATATKRATAVYRVLEVPQVNVARPSRDLANPQTYSGGVSDGDPLNAADLGTFPVDASGDYALDEGIPNLKKRILRRYVTKKDGFAHLPGYGVGVPSYGKRLGTPAVVQGLAADAEVQIGREPDVAKVVVRPVLDTGTPGLVKFQTIVQPKTGKPQKYDVPFDTR